MRKFLIILFFFTIFPIISKVDHYKTSTTVDTREPSYLQESLEHETQPQEKLEPLLTVVIMVKNEAGVIIPTLLPFLQAGIDSFFVYDTGSTDTTVEEVKQFFEEHNIHHGYIAQEPFVDFATSRNRALRLAEAQLPHAVFFVMPDAEWYIHNAEKLLQFCQMHKNDCNECVYSIRMKLTTTWQDTARLIRAHKMVQFYGEIHEAIYAPPSNHVGEEVFFEVRPTPQGIEKSRQRWKRDRKILLKKYQENPRDTRSLFYLAQTEHCLGNYRQAYEYYFIRSHQTGWDEEDYQTHYRLGFLAELLSKTEEDFTWEIAFNHYIQAHNMRPHLIEPLLRIAEHYWPENIPLCFLFARRALELKMPTTERLAIDQSAYNYTVHDIISKSAWYVKEYELGLKATLDALREYPTLPHLLNNLQCYQQALTSATA